MNSASFAEKPEKIRNSFGFGAACSEWIHEECSGADNAENYICNFYLDNIFICILFLYFAKIYVIIIIIMTQ